MTTESANMQQAISKAVRSTLESLQRQSDELHQAIGDLVAACSSSRPSNALPATLRAQSAAAALAASLDVLSRFIAASPQPSRTEPDHEENLRVVSVPIQAAPPEPVRPTPSVPTPMSASPAPAITPAGFERLQAESVQSIPVHEEPIHVEPVPPEPMQAQSEQVETAASEETVHPAAGHIEPEQIEETIEQHAPPVFDLTPQSVLEPEPPPVVVAKQNEVVPVMETPVLMDNTSPAPQASHSERPAAESAVVFDLHSLSSDEQEMHRRANRVAKVSMQDIQLLKPDQVILGRENHDLCIRLNEEIGKARKEYERRFGPILGQGVDYFYHWMVEVLGAGDPEALGEYPYSTPALRH